jgi:hypothetical protein
VGDPKALFQIDTLRPTEFILQEAKIIERSQVSMPLAPKTMECVLLSIIANNRVEIHHQLMVNISLPQPANSSSLRLYCLFSFFVSIELSLSL